MLYHAMPHTPTSMSTSSRTIGSVLRTETTAWGHSTLGAGWIWAQHKIRQLRQTQQTQQQTQQQMQQQTQQQRIRTVEPPTFSPQRSGFRCSNCVGKQFNRSIGDISTAIPRLP